MSDDSTAKTPAPASPSPAELEKRKWLEEHRLEKERKRAAQPTKLVPARLVAQKEHTGWLVKSPIRFRNREGGAPEEAKPGDVLPMKYLSVDDENGFFKAEVIEPHFTDVVSETPADE